jgi:hypothetical protein
MKLTHSILKNLIKEQLAALQDTQAACKGRGGEWTPIVGEGEQGYCSVVIGGGQSSPPTEEPLGSDRSREDVKETTACKKRYKGKWINYLEGCLQHVAKGGDLQGYRQKMGWAKPQKRADRAEAAAGGPGAPQPKRREKTRLGRKGDRILRKKGIEGFDDFYNSLEEHNLMHILNKHGGPDRKWGPAHGAALDALLEAEQQEGEDVADTEKKEAEGKVIDDHHKKLALDAAKKIFQLIDGATYPSEKKEAHAVIKDLEEKGVDLAKLYDAYSNHLKFIDDPDQDENLVQWLKSDDMNNDARKVADAVRARKEKEAAKPKPSWKEKQKAKAASGAEEEMGEEEIGDHTDEEKAAMKKAGVRFNKNTTHSSFAKHQKLFENWNRYVSSIEED